jgi:hypothetical protein
MTSDTSKFMTIGLEQCLGLKDVRPRAMCATLLGCQGYLTLREVQVMYPEKIFASVAS